MKPGHLKKVVIVSGIQAINNPRVVKEADALAEAGLDVEVLGIIYDAESKRLTERLMQGRRWKHTAVADLSDPSLAACADGLWLRIRGRLSLYAKEALGGDRPGQLGLVPHRLYQVAKSRRADLYSAHLEQALWVGSRLIDDGFSVSADVEDWYSEDLLPADRASRPIALMKDCERRLLTGAAYVTTTSKALASSLRAAYGCALPEVVHNSFPTEERDAIDGETFDRKDRSVPSITWFSQTVGPGRGLETLIEALSGVLQPLELHIRGRPRPDYPEALLAGLPQGVANRVHFHPQVPQDELLSRLAEHDIGYCGELADCASRDLTITNKTFEYMRAGLAIIAADTVGQSEVAETAPEAVFLFTQGDAASLRAQLERLLGDPALLAASKAASAKALTDHFDWDQSKRRIQTLAARALGLADAKDTETAAR